MLRDERLKDGTPEKNMNVVIGYDSTGNPILGPVQTDLGMTKWVRALELYWYA